MTREIYRKLLIAGAAIAALSVMETMKPKQPSSAKRTDDSVPGAGTATEGIDPETAKPSPPNHSDRSPREGRE